MIHRVVVASTEDHIFGAKRVADALRYELGFQTRSAYQLSATKRELLVALDQSGTVIGFIRFHHRRDATTTLYEIGVGRSYWGRGVGKALIAALKSHASNLGSRAITLKCPVDLKANLFYQSSGFVRELPSSVPARSRRLFIWKLPLNRCQQITFVASLTASTYDLGRMVAMWEAEGRTLRPFDRCIVTPLFTDPGALRSIRHMRERWGVKVTFDSGGFFVQQGKIRYEELSHKLLHFYSRNDWGDTFVLPDYPPTSGLSAAEVEERVRVTLSEGLHFYSRLPSDLKERSMAVLQGHQRHQLESCFSAYCDSGIKALGFGSFDTKGKNSDINILTESARKRLAAVSDMVEKTIPHPALHLFGVSNPRVLREFRTLSVTSYDSSGWLRTAGYGNVYLPFSSRRNISHGGSAVALGVGQNARDFYIQAERLGHSCAFCTDFRRLQRDRFARMWHNALVFNEMTVQLNGAEAEHQTVV